MKTCILVWVGYLGWMAPLGAQPVDTFAWLKGTWIYPMSRGAMMETWQSRADRSLEGQSFLIRQTDTLLQESIRLIYQDGSWHYVPTVVNQNGGSPVYFKIIWHQRQEFIAENPQHDFPQRIVYRRIGPHLYASIEGRKGGHYRKQNFDFRLKE